VIHPGGYQNEEVGCSPQVVGFSELSLNAQAVSMDVIYLSVDLLENSGDLGQHGMIACLLLLTLEQGIAYGLLLHLKPQDAVVLAERAKHSQVKTAQREEEALGDE